MANVRMSVFLLSLAVYVSLTWYAVEARAQDLYSNVNEAGNVVVGSGTQHNYNGLSTPSLLLVILSATSLAVAGVMLAVALVEHDDFRDARDTYRALRSDYDSGKSDEFALVESAHRKAQHDGDLTNVAQYTSLGAGILAVTSVGVAALIERRVKRPKRWALSLAPTGIRGAF